MEKYLDDFEEIRDALDLHEDFVLLPVEVPSVDVGAALCRWLEDQGHQVRVIAPKEGEWHLLAPTLLSLPADEGGLVVVLGPQQRAEGLALGLNRLNLKRDTLARHLGRPLLWCGPRDFLDTTWENAPDFWSIREITVRMPLRGMLDMSQMVEESPWIEPTPEPALLREQLESAALTRDEPNRARTLLVLSRALVARSRVDEAKDIFKEAAELIERLPSFRRSIDAARALETQGDIGWEGQDMRGAQSAYQRALGAYNDIGDGHGSARTLGKLGRVAYRMNDWEAAAYWYDLSLSVSAQLNDMSLRARLLLLRGRLRAAREDLEGAEQDYGEALRSFQLVDDCRGQSDVLMARGDLRRHKNDMTGAAADYDAARSLRARC